MNAVRVAACALATFLTACGPPQAPRIATVNDEAVLQVEAVAELRAILWRTGESWDALPPAERSARQLQAVARLIDRRLLAQFARETGAGHPAAERESAEEFEQFLRQFPPPDEWERRMKLQALDEAGLQERIQEETSTRLAIERWLAGRPGRPEEAAARDWFADHRAEFAIPERVRASHLFLTRHDRGKPDREPEIRELHRRITAGEAGFEELAATTSDDEAARRRAGDLGWFSRNRVPAGFADRIFDLPPGVLSAPFASPLGWHLVIVREKRPARPATFEECRGEIIAMLESRWRTAEIETLTADLRRRARILRFEKKIASLSPE